MTTSHIQAYKMEQIWYGERPHVIDGPVVRADVLVTWKFHDEMYCHDVKVMSSNSDRVKLGVHSTSVPSGT